MTLLILPPSPIMYEVMMITSYKIGEEEFSSNFVSFSIFEKVWEETKQTKVYDHVGQASRGQKFEFWKKYRLFVRNYSL